MTGSVDCVLSPEPLCDVPARPPRPGGSPVPYLKDLKSWFRQPIEEREYLPDASADKRWPRMKKLLLVDDDPAVHDQVRIMLADLRSEWDIAFVASAEEALAALALSPCDVVLSDIHLVGTGGIEFLTDVKSRYPQTIRIAFSGAAHQKTTLRALEVAHQFLPKPFAPEGVKATLARARTLHDQLKNESLRRLIAEIGTLPSLPNLYHELVTTMQSPFASSESAARIISKDMAMVSKVMQVVNSAFFGLRRTISSPAHAIALLGLDTIKSLVLSLQVFAQFDHNKRLPIPVEALWRHGLATGTAARAIAQTEGVGALGTGGAFIAGLVHDIGVLLLETNFPDQYAEVLRLSEDRHIPPWQVERDLFGATHGDVGGYLLGIWGLSDAVIEAITFHHVPANGRQGDFSVLTAVHVADCLHEESDSRLTVDTRTPIDQEYLAACGLAEHVTQWTESCRQAA